MRRKVLEDADRVLFFYQRIYEVFRIFKKFVPLAHGVRMGVVAGIAYGDPPLVLSLARHRLSFAFRLARRRDLARLSGKGQRIGAIFGDCVRDSLRRCLTA